MGLCFSKKKPPAKPGKIAVAVSDAKAKKPPAQPQKQQPKRAAAGGATANKAAAVVVVRPGSSSAKDAAAGAPAPPGEDTKKKRPSGSHEPAAAPKQLPVVLVPSAPVRTSSCTKEEVDAILIQCGRLSRSSSGAGRAASSSGETTGGGHRRRRSGSKRSYDFDQEARAAGADEECDWERQGGAAAVSRPSPHRGSPQRKRSGSRERSGSGTGSGSRRASRSPGRRGEIGAAASVATAAGSGGGDRARQQQQPGKLVSVPAREKGRAPSPAKRCASPRASSPARDKGRAPSPVKRCASPRASSPARMMAAGNENAAGGGPALSRSSSRRNEQSPYRRNPMAELDENSLRNNSNHSTRPQKKSTETAVAATPKKATGRAKDPTAVAEDAAVAVAASETRAHSSKTTTSRTASIVAESLTTQSRPGGSRSRRASRDFDQNPGSYTTQLLEDIHNYHQQSTSAGAAPPATPATTPSLSLPACVAKACSIVDAVADLNSSSSENNRTNDYEPGHSADDKGSVNAPASGSDGFVQPSAAAAAARKHSLPPVRDVVRAAETEPQESAGSNSVSGHPWTPSWEPTSVESSDRTWSAGDEVVEQSASGSHGGGRCSPMNRPRQSKQRQLSQHEPSGGRSRAAGSGNGSGQYRGRSAHRGSGSVASGRSGVRVISANS